MGIWGDVPTQESEVITPVFPVIKPEIKPMGGLPVRAGGDRIWLLKDGKKHWITNAETYEKLGFKFGDEKDIDGISLSLFAEGEPLR